MGTEIECLYGTASDGLSLGEAAVPSSTAVDCVQQAVL